MRRSFVPPEFAALDRRIWALAFARCINTGGFSVVMPYLALHLHTHLGTAMREVGAVYAVASVVGAVATFAGGELSDRIGRRPLMVCALVLRAVGLAGIGMAIRGGSGLLGIGALVVWNALLRGLLKPSAQAQVSLIVDENAQNESADKLVARRTAAFGLQRVGINLGWALGPAAGGFLAAHSYSMLFFAAAPMTLLAAATVWAIRDPGARAPSDGAARLRLADLWAAPQPRPWILFLVVVLGMSVMTTQLYATMSVYAMGRLAIPEHDFGLLYSVNGVMVVLLQAAGVRFIQRVGLARALLVGPLIYGAGYLLIGEARGFASLGVAVAVVTVGELITEPAELAAATALGDAARPGRVMGVFGLVNALGNSAGPWVGGNLYDITVGAGGRPIALWGTIASLGLWGALGYALVEKLRRSESVTAKKTSKETAGSEGG